MKQLAVMCLLGGLVVLSNGWLTACDDDPSPGPSPDADAGGDADADSDSDSDTDADADSGSDYGDSDLGTDGGLSGGDDGGVATGATYGVQCHFGGLRRWPQPAKGQRVVVKFSTAGTSDIPGEEEWQAVIAAFRSWASIACSNLDFEISSERLTDPDEIHPQDQTLWVYFEDSNYNWQGSPNSVVEVLTIDNGEDPEFLYATIKLNASPARPWRWSTNDSGESDKIDLQSAVTVAIGQVLELGIPDAGESVTLPYPPVNDGDPPSHHRTNSVERRILGASDRAAIQYLYSDGTCSGLPDPARICCDERFQTDYDMSCVPCESAPMNSQRCDPQDW
jgi:hypothetical protein